jgi:hypothetical protein
MQHLIGKRVIVKAEIARDNFGKHIPGKLVEVGGICSFIGKNFFGNLQITVGRLPIEIPNYSYVKIDHTKNA